MEINVYHMKDNDPVQLVGLGDVHIGNINCDKEKFKEIVDWIAADPRRYWIGMGDYVEAIQPDPSEFRYDPRDVDSYFWDLYIKKKGQVSLVNEQIKVVKKELQKIASRCIGMHEGNHEYVFWRKELNPLVSDLCENLGVPFLGPSAFTVLTFPNSKPVTIFSLHGDYGGRREGGAINRLQDIALGYEADIYMMGHTHWVHGSRGIVGYVDFNDGLVYKERKKVYVLTGSFLRATKPGSQSYIERKGLQPRKIGIAVINIDSKRGDIHVSG